MIELSNTDKQWIKMCKGHYQKEYPFAGCWVNTLKPLFKEMYGWDPDEHYYDYLGSMFNRLLDLHLKICDDRSGSNRQLKEIFNASFYQSPSKDELRPIERSISALCGLIQCNQVVENDVERYSLELTVKDTI